jgi:hypothetical protein
VASISVEWLRIIKELERLLPEDHEKFVEYLLSFGPAARNHFLFHYILSGKGRLEARNDRERINTYRLETSQGFMLWPRSHTFYIADERKPWVYAWMEFDGLKARELVTQAGLSFNCPIYTAKISKNGRK